MLIMRKGTVIAAGDAWEPIEEYAAQAKTKVVKAALLPVVGGMAKLWVHWKDGAVGQFDGTNFTELEDYIKTLKGWPKIERPAMMTGPLPFITEIADEEPPAPVVETVEEAPVRVRRQRRK